MVALIKITVDLYIVCFIFFLLNYGALAVLRAGQLKKIGPSVMVPAVALLLKMPVF